MSYPVSGLRSWSYTAFHKQSADASFKVLSNLDYPDQIRFFCTSKRFQEFSKKDTGLERLIYSRIRIFDRTLFKEYWNVKITDQFDRNKIDILTLREFLKTYYGPNPITGKGRVKNICLMPTVVPSEVEPLDENESTTGAVSKFSLNLLEELAKNPKKGHAAKYHSQTSALKQHGKTPAGEARLVILLKGVTARKKPWSKESQNPNERGQVQVLEDLNVNTGYGCETEPDALSQNTAVLAHHAVTGERALGDKNGVEKQLTCGRTRELVVLQLKYKRKNCHMYSGGFRRDRPNPFAEYDLAELDVERRVKDFEFIGVGVMRKFYSESSSILQPYTAFHEQVPLSVLSKLDYPDLIHCYCTSKSAQEFSKKNNGLERQIYSQIPLFGCTHFKEYWNVRISDQFAPSKIDILVLRAFLKIYYGPNPIGTGRVKDVCLMPTIIPSEIGLLDKKGIFAGKVSKFTLNRLGELAEHPKKGHAAKYLSQTDALKQNGETPAGEARLVILLKEVIAREIPWSKESQNPTERGQVQALEDLNVNTGYGCETEPDALSQNTIIFAHHAVTGARPFGNENGMEGRWTYGRTRDLVEYEQGAFNTISGGFRAGKPLGLLEGSSPAELNINEHRLASKSHGVGVMRKFNKTIGT